MAKKYQLVYEDLKEQMRAGTLLDGDRIPSETEMMEHYAVSRQTIRQALEMLEKEGRIEKIRGSGSYVRNLRNVETKRIAVIAYYINSSVFPKTLSAIESFLFEKGYTTMLFSTMGRVERERKIFKQLYNDAVDGIILHATKSTLLCVDVDLLLKIHNRGTKIVFMDNYYPNEEFASVPRVAMEDYAGAYEITRRLIQDGHRNIGGVFASEEVQIRDRLNGVRKAVVDADVLYNDDNFITFGRVNDLGYKLKTCEGEILKLDAFICASGSSSAQVAEFMKVRGRGNIRTIIIFDEVEFPKIEGLNVIMLKHASEEIGSTCAEKILALLRGENVTSSRFPWTMADGRKIPEDRDKRMGR